MTIKKHSGSEIYKFVLSSIPTCPDLKSLLSKIYGEFGMPVIVTDISYHIIAYGGPIPCPDQYWDIIITSGTARPDTVIDGYYKDGYMDRLSAQRDPFLVDWGISKDKPQSTCGIIVNGSLEGISSVLYSDEKHAETALILNAALRDAAEIYLTMRADKYQSSAAPERAFVARILLEDTSAPVQLLESTACYKKSAFAPGYVIIAIQLRNQTAGRLQNLRSSIKAKFPSMLYVSTDDGIYCFFMGIDGEDKVNRILDAIDAEAESKVDHVCGVSQIFHDLNKRSAYVEQARLSLEYGLTGSPDEHRYSFSKLYGSIIMRFGLLNLKPENLILPEIKTLISLDKANGTNFYESFKCYLYEKCDMPKAAARLFLHRNSLMYRIKRAQELMNVDVSNSTDFERLYVCCKVQDLLDKEDSKNRPEAGNSRP